VAALASSLAWFGQPPLGATVREIHIPNVARPVRADVLAAVHRA
jgi:uroporphyrin-III C-methyltransferase / precorrin-2 dehydrogenase / sirohydrochlorin ferrochelatase